MKKEFVSVISISAFAILMNVTLAGGQNRKIGHQPENTVVSAITAAKVGGSTGASINKQMDRQASELKSKLREVKVERLAEGILITIDSRLLFGPDSYGIVSKNILKDLASVMNKYQFTNAIIEGHTDNTGEEVYNQTLSEQRAYEIETFLVGKGVKDARIKTRGYGELQPIASNETEEGKQLNRRIEIAIYANDDVRSAALQETNSALTAQKDN